MTKPKQPGTPPDPDRNMLNLAGVVLPTPATQAAFEVAFSDMAAIANTLETTKSEAMCTDPVTGDSLSLRAEHGRTYNMNGTTDDRRSGALHLTLDQGGERTHIHRGVQQPTPTVSYEEQAAPAANIIEAAAISMEDDQADWMTRVVMEVVNVDDTEIPAIARTLVDESPFTTLESGMHLINKGFKNGTQVLAQIGTGNDTYLDTLPDTKELASLNVRTAEGTSYRYSKNKAGQEHLLVTRPGAEQATDESAVIASDRDKARATNAMLRAIYGVAGEQSEARRQGVDTPTEATLAEFTTVLTAAQASGMQQA